MKPSNVNNKTRLKQPMLDETSNVNNEHMHVKNKPRKTNQQNIQLTSFTYCKKYNKMRNMNFCLGMITMKIVVYIYKWLKLLCSTQCRISVKCTLSNS